MTYGADGGRRQPAAQPASILRACCRGELPAPERAGAVAAGRRPAQREARSGRSPLPRGADAIRAAERPGAMLAGGAARTCRRPRSGHQPTSGRWRTSRSASPGARTRTGHHPRAGCLPALRRRAARSSGAVTCPYPLLGPVLERACCSSPDSPAGAQPSGAGTRLRRSRPGPRRSRRAATSAAASRVAGGMGARTEGGVSFLRGRRPAGHRAGEQALAQRTGLSRWRVRAPYRADLLGQGEHCRRPAAIASGGEGGQRVIGGGARLSSPATPDPVPAFPPGPEFRRCPAWPPVLPGCQACTSRGPRAARPLRPPPAPAGLCRTARQRHDRS